MVWGCCLGYVFVIADCVIRMDEGALVFQEVHRKLTNAFTGMQGI